MAVMNGAQALVGTLKANGIEIGRVEPRIAARLVKLIGDGNSYTSGITSISGGDIRIIIREERVSAENIGKVSFPTATRRSCGTTQYRVSAAAFRP